MERLPELITEILCRLPVKLLLTLRCVSKSFCNIIDRPSFIDQHLKRSMETRTHRRLILHEQNLDKPFPCSEDICVTKFDDELQQSKMLNHPYPPKTFTTIRGSCNGLLLLFIKHEKYHRLVLWNPSTRRCNKLPFCPVYCSVFGLGYDSVNDDYKVLSIPYHYEPTRVWVYSLRSNSWRRFQDLPYIQCKNPYPKRESCFANGALHWLFSNRDYEYIITAFDLATETICIVPLPVKISLNSTTELCGLHVFEGSLCVSFLTTNDVGTEKVLQFELYVREDHGIGFTWSKLYTSQEQFSGLSPKAVKALAYSMKRNKVLLYDEEYMKIVWYDLLNKKGEMIEIDGIHWEYLDAIFCWESLVSLGDDT